ncbi:hypothetical protein Taro_028911 [Colocasia esculenta]|uniref:Uncharacterized protein n=1 Tax=Colocasia esculenta TaxID=4460 RepID=A0A843VVM0_COLES|nr:hypothetical protein [Colocasia esculenta]
MSPSEVRLRQPTRRIQKATDSPIATLFMPCRYLPYPCRNPYWPMSPSQDFA